MTYPRGLEPGRIPTFDNVLPAHVVEALAGGGYACQSGDSAWYTLSGKRWSGAQCLDPAVVEALVLEGHVEILTRDQLPHLGNAKSVQLTDTGKEWHAAMQVEHALRKMDQDCAECLGTGFHRYEDHKDGTPNFSDSAPCSWCRGTGRRSTRARGT